MKKSILIIGGIIISSGILFGQMMHKKMQHNQDPKEMSEHITKMMIKKLNLDDVQAAKLEEINAKFFDKIAGLKEAHRTDVEGILNEEQIAKLKNSPLGKDFDQRTFGMKGRFAHHPKGFVPMARNCGHFGAKPGFDPMGNFGPMKGFGPMGKPDFDKMNEMREKMEKVFEKISEQRKSFDSKLSPSEKAIIVKFKEEIKNEMGNWGEKTTREDRMAKMEEKFKPLLDIAANHKTELEEISKTIESEMPIHNEFIDCMKNTERFDKMKKVRFLLMEF